MMDTASANSEALVEADADVDVDRSPVAKSIGIDVPAYDLYQAMKRRRMHRSFSPERLTDNELKALVYAAGRAPTGRPGYRQFLLIDDPALLKTLRQCCPGFVNDAPLAFLIFTDTVRAAELIGPRGRDVVARFDAGTAAGYLSLAAPALDLGLMISTSWNEGAIQEICGLPEHCRPEVLLAIGRIAPVPSRPVKGKPPIVHLNQHGELWKN